MRTRVFHGALVLAGLLATAPAHAQYAHLQIELAIGSVDRDPAAQAIQLRVTQAGDNALAGLMVVACDSTGGNPVTLCTLPSTVSNGALGARVLLCTEAMQVRFAPAITADFLLTTPIPAAYLRAGSLYLDMPGDDLGPLWRLSWGGSSYQGPGSVESINDPDGDCNPAYAGTLEGGIGQGVQFAFDAGAFSTTNARDYARDRGASQVWNNAGDRATIVGGATPVATASWGALKLTYR